MRRREIAPWALLLFAGLIAAPRPAAADDGISPACRTMFDWLQDGEQVRFHQASIELRRSSYAFLERLAEFAADCPDTRIAITGHTDDVGPAEFNQALSEQRANAVADFLVERGVDRDRLVIAGAGDTQPVGDNATAWGRERNRRIEFELRPGDQA